MSEFTSKIKSIVNANTLKVANSDCLVWVGQTDRFMNEPIIRLNDYENGVKKRRHIWLYRWLLNNKSGYAVPVGHTVVTKTLCGTGDRCVNLDHMVVIGHVTWEDFNSLRDERIQAEHREGESA